MTANPPSVRDALDHYARMRAWQTPATAAKSAEFYLRRKNGLLTPLAARTLLAQGIDKLERERNNVQSL